MTTKSNVNAEKKENDFFVKFNKPYNFEGEVFEGIDLQNIVNLRTIDIIEVERRYTALQLADPIKEASIPYIALIAQVATGKPIEFFELLPFTEMLKLKIVITNSFFSS